MLGRQLPETDVERFWHDGVLFPIRVLTADQARGYRSACDRLLAALGPATPRDHLSQWHLCFRWAYDLALEPAVLGAVASLIGPDILVHSSTLFFKRPDGRSFVPWHQDGYYWQMDAPRLASAWIALSPSTLETGCLRVIRGSHHLERVDHRVRPNGNSLLAGLEVAVEVDERDAVDVCLERGEMSLHHLNAVHGSRPNCGTEPRVGFAVRYVAAGVRQERLHHQVVLACGTDRSGVFHHLPEPPPDDLEDGLAAQQRIVEWIREHLTKPTRGGPSRSRLEVPTPEASDRIDPGCHEHPRD